MKKIKIIIIALIAINILSINVYAGQWIDTAEGTRYQADNSSYPASEWKWIDKNGDGLNECYYFDENGFLIRNSVTPDGKTVNEDGAWTENGVVRTEKADSTDTNDTASDIDDSVASLTLDPKEYQDVVFSTDNLGVSNMALDSIMNPRSNIGTARAVLSAKKYYDEGTDKAFTTPEQQAAVDSFLAGWKAGYIRSGMSENEIYKTIFNYLKANVKYDLKADHSQTSYGALIEHRSVCGGFANTFRTMAEYCGLQSKFLLLSNHAANLVKINGKWYYTDPTQDANAVDINAKVNPGRSAAVYYMKDRPENDDTIDEVVKKYRERLKKLPEDISKENSRNLEIIKSVPGAAKFHLSDGDLVSHITEYAVSQITGSSGSQHIYALVYTDGTSWKDFYKMQFSINGVNDRLNHTLARAIQNKKVGSFTVGLSSSCSDVYDHLLNDSGLGKKVDLWKDEAGNEFVLLSYNINPQRDSDYIK